MIYHLLKFNPESNVDMAEHIGFFRTHIDEDEYCLEYDGQELVSIFNEKSSLLKNKDVLLGSPNGESYEGNPLILIRHNLAKIVNYDIEIVLSNFNDSSSVPEWYVNEVIMLGLDYITAYDGTNEEKWLDGAERIFSLPIIEKNFQYYVNLIQIQLRRNGTSDLQLFNKLLKQKEIDVDISMNLKNLVIALLTKEDEVFKSHWESLNAEEKDTIKLLPIYKVATDDMKDTMNGILKEF